jgi:hypothetical protein
MPSLLKEFASRDYSMHKYVEYQGVYPIVGIGSPHPLLRKGVWPPLGPKWGRHMRSFGGEGGGGSGGTQFRLRDKNSGIIIPLRPYPSKFGRKGVSKCIVTQILPAVMSTYDNVIL